MTDRPNNTYQYIESIDRIFRQRLMNEAIAMGNDGLKLSYNQVLAFIGKEGIRISELAKLNGISKQAMGQVVAEIESLGYLTREPDREDKRAKRIQLTGKGKKLLRDAGKIIGAIEHDFAKQLGQQELSELKHCLGDIYKGLGLSFGSADASSVAAHRSMLVYLEAINRYFESRLMRESLTHGYHGLKLSYGLVIPHIPPAGIRINELAAINEVSKQAIAQLATELENLGYLQRKPDPHDKRAKRLILTARGEGLIADAFGILIQIEEEIVSLLGKRRANNFNRELARLGQMLNKQARLETGELLLWCEQQLTSSEAQDSELQQKIEEHLGQSDTRKLQALLKKLGD